MNLSKILSRIDEDMNLQVFPKNKEIKMEFYVDKDEDKKCVELTFEDGQKKTFFIKDCIGSDRDSIKYMCYKGYLIARYLKLDKSKKNPADIIVNDGKIISISGYTLKEPYSISQVDKEWIIEKNNKLDEIKEKKAFKKEG